MIKQAFISDYSNTSLPPRPYCLRSAASCSALSASSAARLASSCANRSASILASLSDFFALYRVCDIEI
ncbi:hypothetical protein L7849_003650 [Providencia rettgeri]|nr:hypothetical protein [Providencia rettgeri]